MVYTPLTEPFEINASKQGMEYKVKVVYVKSYASCANFFDVKVEKPSGIEPFYLKEKPVVTPEFEYTIWVDEYGKQSELYQVIGDAIATHLRDNLGIFLIDIPVPIDIHLPDNEDPLNRDGRK